jgi:tRNA pseudouridine38-40 synthase
MPRYKLVIEYDGGPFVGWQRQENGRSVQQAIEEAVTAFARETAVVKGAGRTDSGVHALGQVAHIDLAAEWKPDTVRDAINAHLKREPVTILSAERVDDTFDARFSAVRRHYLYRILNRRAQPSLDLGRVWWVTAPLDAAAMHEAARALIGKHDFTTFRSSECQAKSPLKTLDPLDVSREGDEVVIRASARSFLHNQVRSMVGALRKVGDGSWPVAAVGEALAARDRARAGPVAPAAGLYLRSVDY